jgi:CMP-N,N'-diacetyllegionaminic acid synthase
MLNGKSILAIIPARGGSKRLPRKNIIELGGKPLIVWSIEAAIQSQYVDDVVVSSDCDRILEISSEFDVNTIKRPNILAEDTSSSNGVVEHVINTMSRSGKLYDFLVLLQPTSPLRNHEDIDSAFNILFDNDASALISTYKVNSKILKAFSENSDGFIECISNNKYPFMREQDLPEVYMSNGAIYITKVEEFLKEKSFFTDRTVRYIMSKEKSFDIDTLSDLEAVKSIIS